MNIRLVLSIVLGVIVLAAAALVPWQRAAAAPVVAAAKPKLIRVGGSVVDRDGTGLGGVSLLVVPDSGRSPQTLTTAAGGSYGFAIEPGGGAFKIVASHSAYGIATVDGLAGYADQTIHVSMTPDPTRATVAEVAGELSAGEQLGLVAFNRELRQSGQFRDRYTTALQDARNRIEALNGVYLKVHREANPGPVDQLLGPRFEAVQRLLAAAREAKP
jgi:hypothetical protein